MGKDKYRLVIRDKAMCNPNHHIWNNRGVYCCNFTFVDGVKSYRIRTSLKTNNLEEARKRRDSLMAKFIKENN